MLTEIQKSKLGEASLIVSVKGFWISDGVHQKVVKGRIRTLNVKVSKWKWTTIELRRDFFCTSEETSLNFKGLDEENSKF